MKLKVSKKTLEKIRKTILKKDKEMATDSNAFELKKVRTGEFRVSYPSVFEANVFPGQEPKYSITMLFPKKQGVKELLTAAQAAAEEKWGPKYTAILNKIKGTKNWPFHDGDTEKVGQENYEGMVYVKASSKKAPVVLDQQKRLISIEDGNFKSFYAGCYAKAVVIAYTYDNTFGQGLGFSLQALQKQRDGEPFSTRKPVEDDFDTVGVEDNSAFELGL